MAIATTTLAMIGAGAVAVSNAAANIWNATRIGKMKKEFKKNQIELPEEELNRRANQWEMSHGGISGRTAQQFVNYLAGQLS